jgi:hypothetical protein
MATMTGYGTAHAALRRMAVDFEPATRALAAINRGDLLNLRVFASVCDGYARHGGATWPLDTVPAARWEELRRLVLGVVEEMRTAGKVERRLTA